MRLRCHLLHQRLLRGGQLPDPLALFLRLVRRSLRWPPAAPAERPAWRATPTAPTTATRPQVVAAAPPRRAREANAASERCASVTRPPAPAAAARAAPATCARSPTAARQARRA